MSGIDSLADLLRPMFARAARHWGPYASAMISFGAILLGSSAPKAERAEIVRASIGIASAVEIGLLAIFVALLAIFSALANAEFRQRMPRWTIVAGVYLWSVVMSVGSLELQLLLFVGCYLDGFVASNWFLVATFCVCTSYIYTLFLSVVCAHNALRTMIAIGILR